MNPELTIKDGVDYVMIRNYLMKNDFSVFEIAEWEKLTEFSERITKHQTGLIDSTDESYLRTPKVYRDSASLLSHFGYRWGFSDMHMQIRYVDAGDLINVLIEESPNTPI